MNQEPAELTRHFHFCTFQEIFVQNVLALINNF